MFKKYINTIPYPFGSEDFNKKLRNEIKTLKLSETKPYIDELNKSQIKELDEYVKLFTFGTETYNDNISAKIKEIKETNKNIKKYEEELHKSQLKQLESLIEQQKKIDKKTNTLVPVLYVNNQFKIHTPNGLLIGKTPTNAVRNSIKNEKKPMNLVSLSFNGTKIIPVTPTTPTTPATPTTSAATSTTATPATATPVTSATATPANASPNPKSEDQIKANIKKSAINTITSTAGKIRSIYSTSTHKIQTNTLHKLKGWKNYMTRKVKNVSRNIGALK